MDYDEQLDRALVESPDIAQETNRFDIPDPEIREGGKVTVFENFRSVCSRLARTSRHLLTLLQNELGTSADIDDRGRAVDGIV